MRRSLPVALLLVSAATLTAVWANPSPEFGFIEVFPAIRWLVKTIPINYTVDLAALALAVWGSGCGGCLAWRFLPVYNVAVLIAGYAADFAAKGLALGYVFATPVDSAASGFQPDLSRNLHLWGRAESAGLMAAATLLIFASNLLILWLILRWNDAESLRRLPLSAAIIAVVTAPYFSLVGSAEPWRAAFVPALMVVFGAATWCFVSVARDMVRSPRHEVRAQ